MEVLFVALSFTLLASNDLFKEDDCIVTDDVIAFHEYNETHMSNTISTLSETRIYIKINAIIFTCKFPIIASTPRKGDTSYNATNKSRNTIVSANNSRSSLLSSVGNIGSNDSGKNSLIASTPRKGDTSYNATNKSRSTIVSANNSRISLLSSVSSIGSNDSSKNTILSNTSSKNSIAGSLSSRKNSDSNKNSISSSIGNKNSIAASLYGRETNNLISSVSSNQSIGKSD